MRLTHQEVIGLKACELTVSGPIALWAEKVWTAYGVQFDYMDIRKLECKVMAHGGYDEVTISASDFFNPYPKSLRLRVTFRNRPRDQSIKGPFNVRWSVVGPYNDRIDGETRIVMSSAGMIKDRTDIHHGCHWDDNFGEIIKQTAIAEAAT